MRVLYVDDDRVKLLQFSEACRVTSGFQHGWPKPLDLSVVMDALASVSLLSSRRRPAGPASRAVG